MDDFRLKTSIYSTFPSAVFDYQRVVNNVVDQCRNRLGMGCIPPIYGNLRDGSLLGYNIVADSYSFNMFQLAFRPSAVTFLRWAGT